MPLWRAACILLLFNLSFVPSPLLALRISSPNISSSADPPTINVAWTEESGDPQSIDIQIICGSSSILDSPIQVKTSAHGTFIRGDSTWTGRTFTGSCHIQATDGSRILAVSPSFLAPELPTTAVTLSASRSTPKPAPQTSNNPKPTSARSSSGGSRISGSLIIRISSSTTTTSSTSPTSPATSATPTDLPTTENQPSITADLPKISLNPLPLTLSTSTFSGKVTEPPLPPPSPSPSPSHTSRAAIIGGVLGGLVLLALLLGVGLILRRRKTRRPNTGIQKYSIDDPEKTIPDNTLPSLFHNNDTLNTTADPLIIREDYHQPEGKRERFLRVQEEMNDARRRRELLRSNLSTRSRNNASKNGNQRDSEGREIEERLRQELGRMSDRITELEAQLTEVVEPPPDYTSSSHAGNARSDGDTI